MQPLTIDELRELIFSLQTIHVNTSKSSIFDRHSTYILVFDPLPIAKFSSQKCLYSSARFMAPCERVNKRE